MTIFDSCPFVRNRLRPARRISAGAARPLAILTVAAGLSACAGIGGPPGGIVAREIPSDKLCTKDLYEENPPPGFDVKNHVFAVDHEGRYDGSAIAAGDAARGDFETQFVKILEAHARFRQRPEAAGKPNRILLFINGGMNTVSTGLERAAEQAPCMLKAGYFPIFLIWHTGLFDSYWEQVARVRNGHLYAGVRATTPLYVLADIGQGIARAPATYLSQFGRYLDGVALYGEPVVTTSRLNVRFDGPNEDTEGLLIGGLIFTLTAPAKLLTTPFTDAMGKTAWQNMVRRTRTTVRTPAEFDGLRRNGTEIGRYPKGTGGFSKFFSELERCVTKERECIAKGIGRSLADAELTLIGHSLGTMVLNDLIRLYDNLPYRNVVYMAAANSIREFLNTLVPVMKRKPELRFYNLSLHPVADAREITGLGSTPSGSLLEWVDDMYEKPPTMLDRTLGKWVNVAAAEHVFPDEARARMLFKIFGFRRPNSEKNDPGDPTVHGDFNDTEMHYWLPDFWGRPDDWPY